MRSQESQKENTPALKGLGSLVPCQGTFLPPSWSLQSGLWRPQHLHGKPCGASSRLHSSSGWRSLHRHEHIPHSSVEGPGIKEGGLRCSGWIRGVLSHKTFPSTYLQLYTSPKHTEAMCHNQDRKPTWFHFQRSKVLEDLEPQQHLEYIHVPFLWIYHLCLALDITALDNQVVARSPPPLSWHWHGERQWTGEQLRKAACSANSPELLGTSGSPSHQQHSHLVTFLTLACSALESFSAFLESFSSCLAVN